MFRLTLNKKGKMKIKPSVDCIIITSNQAFSVKMARLCLYTHF